MKKNKFSYEKFYESIVTVLKDDKAQFIIPSDQVTHHSFPEFLKIRLDQWINYYNSNLKKIIDDVAPVESGKKDAFISRISNLTDALSEVVKSYFEGNVSLATSTFFKSLDASTFDDYQLTNTIPLNYNFYRVRQSEDGHLKRTDLFHIPFEKRHLVSTNRYSIPGFPALYLGDSTFTCWAEFDQPYFGNLWFSRLINTRSLNVIKLHLLDDLLKEVKESNLSPRKKSINILNYLLFFPLTLACTIKVKEKKGSFKPEYIIPQLLLQYVSKNKKIDGIQYPSTKIDYSKLHNIDAYNYVFPVKTSEPSGFCKQLSNVFKITEPTTLNLEYTIKNPSSEVYVLNVNEYFNPSQFIEFFEGEKNLYSTSSFGELESKLIKRLTKNIL